MNEERRFPMHDGPWIPWSLAQIYWRAYRRLYEQDGVDMEVLARRGGFAYDEIYPMFESLRRRDKALWRELMILSGRDLKDMYIEERLR